MATDATSDTRRSGKPLHPAKDVEEKRLFSRNAFKSLAVLHIARTKGSAV
jgi:hypothetical protein